MPNPEQQNPRAVSAEDALAQIIHLVHNSANNKHEFDEIFQNLFSKAQAKAFAGQATTEPPMSQAEQAYGGRFDPVAVEEDTAPSEPSIQETSDSKSQSNHETYAVLPGQTLVFPLSGSELAYNHITPGESETSATYLAGVKGVIQAEVSLGIDLMGGGLDLPTKRVEKGLIVTDLDEARFNHREILLHSLAKRMVSEFASIKGVKDKKSIDQYEEQAERSLSNWQLLAMISPSFVPRDVDSLPLSARGIGCNVDGGNALDIYLRRELDEDGNLIDMQLDTRRPQIDVKPTHIGRLGIYGAEYMLVYGAGFSELPPMLRDSNDKYPQLLVASASQPISLEDVDDQRLRQFAQLKLVNPQAHSAVDKEPPKPRRSRTRKPGQNTGKRHNGSRNGHKPSSQSSPTNGHKVTHTQEVPVQQPQVSRVFSDPMGQSAADIDINNPREIKRVKRSINALHKAIGYKA